MRQYPEIPNKLAPPKRQISFICVKFSNEFDHNIIKSECIHDDLNEFIVIDNTANIFYPTLGQAINAGIEQAMHDLLVVVHEDVLLLPRWQAMFEQSLTTLENEDPDWLVAGVVGWDASGKTQGHLSDPHSYRNSLSDKAFAEITRIDEQVLILRKSKGLFLDPELPSIHHIGRDLPLEAAKRGFKAYVINAPSIHKYADAQGNLIQTARDSVKIQHRQRLSYLADRACSDEYIQQKWPTLHTLLAEQKQPGPWVNATVPEITQLDKLVAQDYQHIFKSPIILLGKGGGGSRLLSTLADDLKLFIGNDINPTGDSREMARSIYRAIIRKFQCPNEQLKKNIVPDLQATAIQMLRQGNWPEKWAFKVPESLFTLPELKLAFPNARYIFLKRDPVSTVLRRSHMTARLDNQVGQITLPLAYDVAHIPRQQILADSAIIHSCRTTAHQFGLVSEFRENIPQENWLTLSFENLLVDPGSVLSTMASFTEQEMASTSILTEINQTRAATSCTEFSDDILRSVNTILQPTRSDLGYS